MNFIEFIRVKRRHKMIKELEEQSKRKKCCESCKFCKLYEIIWGYNHYTCALKVPDFETARVQDNICYYYEPCKKYKKYLNIVEGDKNV